MAGAVVQSRSSESLVELATQQARIVAIQSRLGVGLMLNTWDNPVLPALFFPSLIALADHASSLCVPFLSSHFKACVATTSVSMASSWLKGL